MFEAETTSSGARLVEARTQLVSAAQWLARVERSFGAQGASPELSLRWSGERGAIATHAFATEIALELKIDGLVMQFTEKGAPSDHEIDVEERSPAQIEAWILIELLHRGVDRDRFSKELPYDVSALLSGDGVEFSPGAYDRELRALAGLYRRAAAALRGGAGPAAPLRVSAQDLRLEAVADGRAAGFSPGDQDLAEPYFYVEGESGAVDPARRATAVLRASEAADDAAVAAFFARGGGRGAAGR